MRRVYKERLRSLNQPQAVRLMRVLPRSFVGHMTRASHASVIPTGHFGDVSQGATSAQQCSLLQWNTKDPLGRLGLLTLDEQRQHTYAKVMMLSIVTFLGLVSGGYAGGILFACVGGGVGLYLGLIAYVVWRKTEAHEVSRLMYFHGPLIAEELLLLVKSGLALLSAMSIVCDGEVPRRNVLLRSLQRVYVLSTQGIPINEAFQLVSRESPFSTVKQFLLHLEASCSVGGELSSALQGLADQIHQEWKHSVETRVKRLENYVVFPVFSAVIGLMLLTAAVPLVPVFEFMESVSQKNASRPSSLMDDQE